eukprot:754191-Hanusia_phi.AAC.18
MQHPLRLTFLLLLFVSITSIDHITIARNQEVSDHKEMTREKRHTLSSEGNVQEQMAMETEPWFHYSILNLDSRLFAVNTTKPAELGQFKQIEILSPYLPAMPENKVHWTGISNTSRKELNLPLRSDSLAQNSSSGTKRRGKKHHSVNYSHHENFCPNLFATGSRIHYRCPRKQKESLEVITISLGFARTAPTKPSTAAKQALLPTATVHSIVMLLTSICGQRDVK